MKINKLKAHTLAELSVILLIFAFVCTIIIKVLNQDSHAIEKLRIKNANVALKMAVGSLIKNPDYYAIGTDFANTKTVTIDGTSYIGNFKFSGLMLKELGVSSNDAQECEVLASDFEVKTMAYCYISDNSVVFGFPPTDFVSTNVVRVKNPSGSYSNYAPITIYANPSVIQKKNHFEENAIIVGVRRDGATTIITTVDCEDSSYKNTLQCKAIDYMSNAKVGSDE